MPLSDLHATVSGIGAWFSQIFDLGAGPILELKNWILLHFGSNGLIAALIISGVLLFYLIIQIVRLAIATLKYLVLPAIALAFLATLILPVSFYAALPVTAVLCSIFLIFKA
jgi:hypothetical protein